MFDEKSLIIKDILKKKSLCPGCDEEMIEYRVGELFLYSTENEEIKYILCKECLKKINKIRKEKQIKFFKKIEIKLENNFRLYSAILESKSKPLAGELKESGAIAELPIDNPWNEDDRKYFENNPKINYRARKIYPGELEETYKNNAELKKSAENNNITTAIVHKISDGQRVRAYVNSLEGYPREDEDFIAALFQILMNDFLKLEDLDSLYQEIKRRNSFVKEAVEAYLKEKEE